VTPDSKKSFFPGQQKTSFLCERGDV